MIYANIPVLKDLLDFRTKSGAKHFVDLPEAVFFDELANHTENLYGAEITEFAADGVVEMWLEFGFRGHRFSVNNQFGDYLFFVEDPDCPEEILFEVIDHFRRLLEK